MQSVLSFDAENTIYCIFGTNRGLEISSEIAPMLRGYTCDENSLKRVELCSNALTANYDPQKIFLLKLLYCSYYTGAFLIKFCQYGPPAFGASLIGKPHFIILANLNFEEDRLLHSSNSFQIIILTSYSNYGCVLYYC